MVYFCFESKIVCSKFLYFKKVAIANMDKNGAQNSNYRPLFVSYLTTLLEVVKWSNNLKLSPFIGFKITQSLPFIAYELTQPTNLKVKNHGLYSYVCNMHDSLDM